MEELLEILEDVCPDIDFENEDNLVEDGLIDSFDIVRIVSAVKEEFDVEFTIKDIVPENFASAKCLHEAILRLQD